MVNKAHMENPAHPTNSHDVQPSPKNPATIALAIVGFIALVVLGIILAIYSARYIPQAITKLTPKLSPIGDESPALVVTSSTTLPFTTSVEPGQMATAGTAPASQTYTTGAPVSSAPTAHTDPYGLPNLKVTIISTGYLANGTTGSFVPAQVIPVGARAAVRFSIANTGTNYTGPWSFAAAIPTQSGYVFTSPIEAPMGPGDHTVFTLGFDQADIGANHPISIIADPQNMVQESNEGDNSQAVTISVLPQYQQYPQYGYQGGLGD